MSKSYILISLSWSLLAEISGFKTHESLTEGTILCTPQNRFVSKIFLICKILLSSVLKMWWIFYMVHRIANMTFVWSSLSSTSYRLFLAGHVCIPIDPNHCEEFDPSTVPTLSTVRKLMKIIHHQLQLSTLKFIKLFPVLKFIPVASISNQF